MFIRKPEQTTQINQVHILLNQVIVDLGEMERDVNELKAGMNITKVVQKIEAAKAIAMPLTEEEIEEIKNDKIRDEFIPQTEEEA